MNVEKWRILPTIMKRLLLLSLFILQVFGASYAQSWERAGDWGNDLYAVDWIDEQLGYAAGEGIFLKSTDGGSSWLEISLPVEMEVYALRFFDGLNGYVVGNDGLVFKTTDGASSWQQMDLGATSDLLDLYYITKDQLWIVGAAGKVYKTSNNGGSWTSVAIGSTEDLNAVVFTSANNGYIVSSLGKVFRTLDAGAAWSASAVTSGIALNDIYFSDENSGFAVGDAGLIFRTVNGGSLWQEVKSGTNYNYNTVSFSRSNPKIGIVGGEGGYVLYTNNTGQTFLERTSRTTEDVHDLVFAGQSELAIGVGDAGNIIRSTNSGNSWSLSQSGFNKDFYTTDFVTDSRGYIAGNDGLVLFTSNSGLTFTDRTRPLVVDFYDIEFESTSFGYLVGDEGTVLQTSNSGASWLALNPQTEKDLYGLFFYDANEGYVVGEQGFIGYTNDRGVSWVTLEEGLRSYNFRDIAFFENKMGIIIGDGGKILRSNNGVNWVEVSAGVNQDFTSLSIVNETTALAIGKSGQLIRTRDNGLTWTRLNTNHTTDFNGLAFADEMTGFIVGVEGLILETKDQGESWEQIQTGTLQDFYDINFGDATTAYAVGEYGLFYKYSCALPTETGTIEGFDNICMSQQVYTLEHDESTDYTYEWRVDGGEIIEGQGTDRVIINWEISGRNSVIVKSLNVCGEGPVAALEVTVSTQAEAVNQINGVGVSCLGVEELYSVDSIPGMEYSWEVSNGMVVSGQGTAHVKVAWNGQGSQVLTVFPGNVCGLGPESTKVIEVGTVPQQPSEIVGPARVGLEEQSYRVTTEAGINYQWSTNGGGTIVSGQGSAEVLVNWDREGDYLLEVIPMNACNEGPKQLLSVNVDLITAIANEGTNMALKIYPNPSQGDIHIEAKGIGTIHDISVIDAMGRRVYVVTLELGKFNFELNNLPKGMLLIVLETSEGRIVEKVWIK